MIRDRYDRLAGGKIALMLLLNLAISNAQVPKSTSGHPYDTFMKIPDSTELKCPAYKAPDWLKDAVIVEIPIRGFNVPGYNNPEKWKSKFGDGTYLSVIDKLDFLREFGVNVICLYTVYWNTPGTNLYAIRHDAADPDLGTLDDIRTLVKSAHEKGIRVLSNTNHYGVDQSSPMIGEHPDWFLPIRYNLYGQRVFDLNNPEVVNYIIDTHVWWCTEVGLDGWRIDIAHETYRKYIWDSILVKCNRSGKQILLATEGVHLEGHIRGVGWSKYPPSIDMEDPFSGWENPKAEYGSMKSFSGSAESDPYDVKDISSQNTKTPFAYNCDPEKYAREGAYNIQGSRYLFGYNLMFAPFVPWMMAGELFNATHLAVPGLLNHRLNGKLLHSYINWDDIKNQQDVIHDFMKIAGIRISQKDIFHNNRYETNLVNVPFDAEPYINVKPYARFIPGKKALIVVGNNNIEEDVTFRLHLPLDKMDLAGNRQYLLTDLWNDSTSVCTAEQLADSRITVPRDKTPGGGVRVLLIAPK